MIELGKTSPAFRSVIGTTVGIGSQGTVFDDTPAQQAQWLPRLASGEMIASLALTEPGAGSDAASLRSTAILRRHGPAAAGRQQDRGLRRRIHGDGRRLPA